MSCIAMTMGMFLEPVDLPWLALPCGVVLVDAPKGVALLCWMPVFM
jgi:hypothetical protein